MTEDMPSAPIEAPVTQELGATVQHTRLLAAVFKKSAMEVRDGGLLVKDVPMLAAGTWTDSAVQTPLNYPDKTLREYAANWSDVSGWARHSGGVPRDATDKVAELQNPRYQDGAVVGDIFLHGATQKSRDMIELIKRKLIAFVSVEHTGDERYNASTRQLEATSINFSGFAFVNKGACKLCRINEAAPLVSATIEEAPLEVQDETMDTKELESKMDAMAKELAELRTPKVEVIAPVIDNSRELADLEEVKAVKQELETLRTQMKELMSQPAAAPVAVAAPVEQKSEYSAPSARFTIDRKNRSISQE